MKHMMMALLIVPYMTVASEQPMITMTPVTRLLLNGNGDAALDWREKGLVNDDLPKNCNLMDPKVTYLDLSNNNFHGHFSLKDWLHLFPNLQELRINNNPGITHLALEEDFGNTKLKKLCLRNSGCKELNVDGLYRNFALEVVDVCGSKQLTKFAMPGGGVEPWRKELKLNMWNIGIPESRLAEYQKNGFLYSAKAGGIMSGFMVVATVGYISCLLSNVPVQANYTNVSLGLVFPALAGGIGYKIGEIVAQYSLPNGGKVRAIEFVIK